MCIFIMMYIHFIYILNTSLIHFFTSLFDISIFLSIHMYEFHIEDDINISNIFHIAYFCTFYPLNKKKKNQI